MAPGDAVRFVPVRADRAPSLRTIDADRRASLPLVISTSSDDDDGVLGRFTTARRHRGDVRRGGDGGVLVEYGPMVLDLAMRARVHVLTSDCGRATAPASSSSLPASVRCRCSSTRPALDARSRRSAGGLTATAAVGSSSSCRAAPSSCRCRGTTRRPTRRSSATCTACARRAVVPVEHRVHPPHQRPRRRRRRCTTSSSTPSIWCSASVTSTWARRWPLPWIPGTVW